MPLDKGIYFCIKYYLYIIYLLYGWGKLVSSIQVQQGAKITPVPFEAGETLLSALFPPELRPGGPGVMEYDAQREGTFIFSHLDGDIARLVRLRQALEHTEVPFEVLCFPWQTAFLHGYLGGRAALREIAMDALEEALGMIG